MACKHRHGDNAHHLGGWLCGQCFEILESRPRRYRMVPIPAPSLGGPNGVHERQEISWQAEVLKSPEGTTLSVFLAAIAQRFGRRNQSLSKHESYRLALDALKGIGAPFGHPDYDWSRASAIDIADEEMTYWDEEAHGGNS